MSLKFRNRIFLMPDGDANAGGTATQEGTENSGGEGEDSSASSEPGGNGSQNSGEGLLANANPSTEGQAPATETPNPDPAPTPEPGTIANRPDHIAEQFWDVEKGTPKIEALAKGYNELRNQNNKLMADKGQGSPEKAEDYLTDYKPPHRSRPSGDQKEGDVMHRYGELDAGDPVFVAVSKFAKNGNMSKGNFDDGMQQLMEDLHEILPEPLNPEKEMEILGETGKQMVDTSRDWADTLFRNGVVNEGEFTHLLTLGKNAIGIQLMNKLRLNSGEKPIPIKLNGGANNGVKTPDECSAMMAMETAPGSGALLKDEDSPAGAAHREAIDKAFAETFGTEVA